MLVAKIMNAGYHWPSMHVDAEKQLRKCSAFQRHASNSLCPKNMMIPVTSAWPFQKLAIDITGPFLEAPGRVKFLIVSIDYFTKWIEAKPLTTINSAIVKNSSGNSSSTAFVYQSMAVRIKHKSDVHFCSTPTRKWRSRAR